MTVIVGIHGLANKPPKDVLTEWWDLSIKEGLKKNEKKDAPGYRFEMVFWADLLYRVLQHHEPDFTFDKLYNDQPYIEADELKEHDDNWLDKVREYGEDLGGSLVDTIHRNFGTDALSKVVVDKVLRDLSFYYDEDQNIAYRKGGPKDGQKALARRVLMDELKDHLLNLEREDNDEVVLISHSMGSIIAYDVLREIGRDNPDFKIEYFLTIGSPLGLPTVKANVHKVNKDRDKKDWVRTPTVVRKRWINFADRRDLVSLDNHLKGDYGENADGIEVEDDIVHNDYRGERNREGKFVTDRRDAKANPHKSYGYLRTPEMSDFLTSVI